MNGYVIMCRELLLCKWLSPTDKIVYTMIADKYEFAEKFGSLTEQKMMELSIRRLSEQSGIDRRAIRKSLDKLCDKGFISEHKTLGGKSYYVADIKINEVDEYLKLCRQADISAEKAAAKKNIA